ncbi:hypothetical protein [Schlesneria paludicola]|uniref:hypothetical protein n=1 Tax=Schlesneria paludicola TaxID=360056 RepID=UPI00029AA438|nr:hypothetical protein [Schlesneria paludicola]
MDNIGHTPQAKSSAPDQHERTDIKLRPIGLFAIVLTMMIAGVLLLLDRAFWTFETAPERIELPQSQIAADHVLRGPALQAQPRRDLVSFRRTEEQRLSSYGWVDSKRNLGRIPIDAAMKILAERGFPEPTDSPKSAVERPSELRSPVDKQPDEKPTDEQQEVPR